MHRYNISQDGWTIRCWWRFVDENKAFAIEWVCLRHSYLNMFYKEETYEQAIGVSKISV